MWVRWVREQDMTRWGWAGLRFVVERECSEEGWHASDMLAC